LNPHSHNDHKNLNLARLPIPPRPQNKIKKQMEAAPGFEPGMKVLQTCALPLGYAATPYCVYDLKQTNKS
jgi:hypothetical protein